VKKYQALFPFNTERVLSKSIFKYGYYVFFNPAKRINQVFGRKLPAPEGSGEFIIVGEIRPISNLPSEA